MRKILICYLLSFLSWAWGLGNDSEVLKARLNAFQTMKADFTQVVKANHRVLSKSTGEMSLARPGRFRWQVKSPMEQIIIADGKHLWVYDVELEQVTVKRQSDGMAATAALFLSGDTGDVIRDFTVAKSQKKDMDVFTLQAKSSKEPYSSLVLFFTGNVLKAITFNDQLDQTTQVFFNNTKNNVAMSPTVFEFHVPKGVDVIKQ